MKIENKEFGVSSLNSFLSFVCFFFSSTTFP